MKIIIVSKKQKEEFLKAYKKDYEAYLTSGGGEATIYFMGICLGRNMS